MLSGIASEVGELRTSKRVRPFKQDKQKILLLGNCVVNKLASLLSVNDNIDALFFSNLHFWGNYDEESFLERASEADLIISLAANSELRHSQEAMTATYGDRCIFVPLIWVDGLDTLQMFAMHGNARFLGGDRIVRRAEEVGFVQARRELIEGKLRTDSNGRFLKSITTMERLEKSTIKISDFLLENYQDKPMMNAVGHPSSSVISTLFRRVIQEAGLKAQTDILEDASTLGRLELPESRGVLCPYVIEEMSFNYAHDPSWILNADSLLSIVRSQVKNDSYIFIEEA